MTNIPKKLDVINRDDHVERFLHAAGVEDTFEIRNKVNELIDYLQAKEEEMSFMLDIAEERGYWQGRKEDKEEANKLQARAAKHIENNQHEYDEIRDKCFCGREKKSVYHIEASKGECGCACHDPKYGSYHGQGVIPCCSNPDKKLDPPEHEDTELGKLEKDYIDSFGDLFHTWSSYGWWIKYIRSNYISKEKIKRAIDKELDELRGTTACTFYDFADDLKESLGLGD